MRKAKILTKDTENIAEAHKETVNKLINLPVSLRFDEGEFPLSDIRKESIKIKNYNGCTGEIIAGGIKIGEGIVRKKNDNVQIKMKILPKKHLTDVLEKSKVHITCVLDTFMLPVSKVEELGHNSIIRAIDTIPGEAVSVLINGIKMAYGELCIAGDRFGARIIEIVDPDKENTVLPRPGDEPEAFCYILLGKREATVKELYTIGEGTIIQFDDPVSDLFPLHINGQPLFLVEILSKGENFTARIYNPNVFTKYLTDEITVKEPEEQKIKTEEKKEHVPFNFIKELEAFRFYPLLQQEHPQTIALILSYLPPEISRIALLSLPEELKADITERISSINNINNRTLYQIEEYIKNKIAMLPSPPLKEPGGIEHAVKILHGIVNVERKKILDIIKQKNTILADEIKKNLEIMA